MSIKEKSGRALAALALGLVVCAAAASAQPPTPQQQPAAAAKQAPAATPAKPGFTVKVSKTGPVPIVNIKAKDAKLAEVAAELSRQLDAPVNLSPVMSKQVVSVEVDGLNLESAVRMLAPHPLIDYVAEGGAAASPKALAVYLYALNEQHPPLTETVKSSSEALLIEGDTEEGTEEYERRKKEDPLQVSFANNRLSVRAEKQPLALVLARVASELGIPFELKGDPTEMVDVTFQGYMFDQAMRALSPSVRFYYRSDLGNFETYPIRLALAEAAAPGRANKN